MIPTWGAAFGANAIFNSAEFRADLTHSAVPDKAATSTTATFTRATTATVRDNEGVLRTAIAGEARFEGARRIRNLIAGSSEDLANASWSSILVTAPTPTTVLATAGAGAHHRFNAGPAAVAGNTYVLQAKLTAGTARYAVLGDRGDAVYRSVTFDLQTGTKGAEHNATGTMEDLGGGQYLCTAKFVRTNGGTVLYPAVGITDSNSSYIESGFVAAGTETIIAEEIQLEDVTGQTTQTAGEYVSVGVASSPYYHGSMVDGVKCFATDINGAAIPSTTLLGYQAEGARTNLCLQSNAFTTAPWTNSLDVISQNAAGVDGATSAWTLTDSSAVALRTLVQAITFTAAVYTVSCLVKKTSGATVFPILYVTTGGVTYGISTIDTNNGVATAWTSSGYGSNPATLSAACSSFNSNFWRVSLTFTATAAAWSVTFAPAATANATQSSGTADTALTGSQVVTSFQVELGSFASSYISTTTVAVTRNADTLIYTSAGNASTAAGWMYFESYSSIGGSEPRLVISDGTITSNSVFVDDSNLANGSTRYRVYSGSALQADISISSATSSNTLQKRSATWGSNSANCAQNGTLGTADTVVTVPASFTTIGVGGVLGTPLGSSTFRNIRIGQRVLSSSEQQAVTA